MTKARLMEYLASNEDTMEPADYFNAYAIASKNEQEWTEQEVLIVRDLLDEEAEEVQEPDPPKPEKSKKLEKSKEVEQPSKAELLVMSIKDDVLKNVFIEALINEKWKPVNLAPENIVFSDKTLQTLWEKLTARSYS